MLERRRGWLNKKMFSTKKEKQRAVEQATIAQFPLNTECIYFGTIENTNDAKESLLKFGHTNDLATRGRHSPCGGRCRPPLPKGLRWQ
jgi:hypothetical protein